MKRMILNLIITSFVLASSVVLAAQGGSEVANNPADKSGDDFRFVVTADTQYPRVGDDNNNQAESRRLILIQAQSVREYRSSNGGEHNVPLFIDGDITEYGHGWQRNFMYQTAFPQYGANFYAGLGNHDYQNNVNDCANNGCARDMVEDAVYRWVRNYNVTSFDHRVDEDFWNTYRNHYGSLSYSKLFGEFLMIQLQNEPTYEVYFESNVLPKKKFFINSSLDWLEGQLRWARANGKVVILHMHKPPFSNWSENGSSSRPKQERFRQLLRDYRNVVVAIFAGHLHIVSRYQVEGIPVFVSGAPMSQSYVIGEYTAYNRKLRVYEVENNQHQNKRLLGDVIDVPPSSEEDFTDAAMVLYKRNNAEGNALCTVKLDYSRTFNFGGNSGCANDDARSGKITMARAGTIIKYYGNWNANNNCDQGCSTITVKQNIRRGDTPVVIPSFEYDQEDNRVRVVRSGGQQQLDGKISSARLTVPTG